MGVSIIDSIDAFQALRDEWNHLLENSRQKTIFLTWEWLFTWWQVYNSKSQRLHIYTVREKGQLTGIAPLYISRRYLSSALHFMGSNIVASDYLDFILLKTSEEESLAAILASIKESNQWDVLSLANIPAESNNVPKLRSYFGANKTIFNDRYSICPYIDLQSDWEGIFQSFSPTIKSLINRKAKKLESFSNVVFISISPDDDYEGFFSHFVQLNRLRFNKKGVHSPFDSSEFTEFHSRFIEVSYEKDMVKLVFLKANDELIAGIYILKYDNKYLYYQSGFDPAWENVSPGTLLFNYVIKDANKRKIREFDFLQGNEKYKSSWTRTNRYNVHFLIYNINILSQLMYWRDKYLRQLKVIRKHMASLFNRIKY